MLCALLTFLREEDRNTNHEQLTEMSNCYCHSGKAGVLRLAIANLTHEEGGRPKSSIARPPRRRLFAGRVVPKPKAIRWTRSPQAEGYSLDA
jgi:hypothetical protein